MDRQPKIIRTAFLGLFVTFMLLYGAVHFASAKKDTDAAVIQDYLSYISPRPGAMYVHPNATIAVRRAGFPRAEILKNFSITVEGSKSGKVLGKLILSTDGETLIFEPTKNFTLGESVVVTFNDRRRLRKNIHGASISFSFSVAQNVPVSLNGNFLEIFESTYPSTILQKDSNAGYISAPANLPKFRVTGDPGRVGEGYIFIGFYNYVQGGDSRPYGLIIDNFGEPIYYTNFPLLFFMDFKKQSNGLITTFARVPRPGKYYAIDSTYKIVKTYETQGYWTDLHELQVLDNGHALLLAHDQRVMDMSQYVPDGNPNALVIGCTIQEFDSQDNLIFEWRSWDYMDEIEILDSNYNLTADRVPYIHCNSLEEDTDGNILFSSRHLDEITKINRSTGEIIWRMGGRKSDFKFVDDKGFRYPHDVRRLDNGHITIYDNGVSHSPALSRGVEYTVDELSMTVSRVAEFRRDPDLFAVALGNMQRLPNGNTLIGWGRSSKPVLSEFDQNGNIIFELFAPADTGSYRAFRYPWQGVPSYPPNLVAFAKGNDVKLYFHWNGSTETVAYKILGGRNPDELEPIDDIPRNGFETSYSKFISQNGSWYFQIVPIDKQGKLGLPSNIANVYIGPNSTYVPLVQSSN